jgi:hypothetical protein
MLAAARVGLIFDGWSVRQVPAGRGLGHLLRTDWGYYEAELVQTLP